MSKWNKERLEKKAYRRGGVEPDPPRRCHKKRDKPFRLEYKPSSNKYGILTGRYFGSAEWRGRGRYITLQSAMTAAESVVRKRYYKSWRVKNVVTGEIIWTTKASD